MVKRHWDECMKAQGLFNWRWSRRNWETGARLKWDNNAKIMISENFLELVNKSFSDLENTEYPKKDKKVISQYII